MMEISRAEGASPVRNLDERKRLSNKARHQSMPAVYPAEQPPVIQRRCRPWQLPNGLAWHKGSDEMSKAPVNQYFQVNLADQSSTV